MEIKTALGLILVSFVILLYTGILEIPEITVPIKNQMDPLVDRIFPPPPTPSPEPTPFTEDISQIPYETLAPIPTLEIIEALPPEPWREGERDLGEPFSIHRDNVSGFKSLDLNITVYRYKILRHLTAWSISWGRFIEVDPDPGYIYLAVFINVEMVGNNSSQDPRMWGFSEEVYRLQYGSIVITRSQDYDPSWQIMEMDTVSDLNNVERVSAYGYRKDEPVYYLRMGRSNCWDGYLIYTVPETEPVSDMSLLGSFGGFGSAWWRLKG